VCTLSWISCGAFAESPKTTPASAETTINQLLECLEQSDAAPESNSEDSAQTSSLHAYAARYVIRIQMLLKNSQFTEAQQICQELMVTGLPKKASCLKLARELSAAIDAAATQQRKHLEDRLEKFKGKVEQEVLNAKTAAELDGLLAESQKFAEELGKMQGYHGQTNVFPQMIARWQEYLALAVAGETAEALNILNQISNDSSRPSIVPRSKVLELRLALKNRNVPEKATTREEIAQLLEQVTSPEDLPAVREKIEAFLSTHPRDSYRASGTLARILELEKAANLIREGDVILALHSLRSQQSSGEDGKWVSPIMDALWDRALTASIPPAYQPHPRPKALSKLIIAAAENMKKAEDWPPCGNSTRLSLNWAAAAISTFQVSRKTQGQSKNSSTLRDSNPPDSSHWH
jgi:hypothetical protein